jgi:hypothetical protein
MTMVHASRLREFLQEHGLGNIYTLLEPEGVSVTDMHKSVEQGGDTFYDWMRSLKVPYKDIDTLERALRKKEGGVSMKAIEETGDARALLAAMAAAGQSAKPAQLAAPAFNGDILSAALGKVMSIDADAVAAARAEEAAAAAAAEKKRPARPKSPEARSYYDPIPITFADTPFVPSATFVGRQAGYVFKAGKDGVGYYRDAPDSAGGEWKAYAQPADWDSGLPS